MKLNYDTIGIDCVDFHENGMTICWSANIGFGQVYIVKTKGTAWDDFESEFVKTELTYYSEYMDTNEDKSFISHIMKLFIESLIVE